MVIYDFPFVKFVPFWIKPGYKATLIFTTLFDPSMVILDESMMKYCVIELKDKSVVNCTSKVFAVSVLFKVTGHIEMVVQLVPESVEYCTSDPTSCFIRTVPEASKGLVELFVKVSKEYSPFALVANTFTVYTPFIKELKEMVPDASMVIPGLPLVYPLTEVMLHV